MTPEQRQLAEEIADYVRREVREVGLLLERPDGSAGGAWRLAWVAQIGDGSTCTWISAEDDVSWEGSGEEPVEMALCVRVDGIPDLSDDATVDALLRHLRRWGWTQERSRAGMVGLWRDGCIGVYTIPWKAIGHAIKEEASREA